MLSIQSGATFDCIEQRGPRTHFQKLGRAALPQRCMLCVAHSGGALLCNDCADALPAIPAACPICALPTQTAAICGRCLARPPPFDATIAAFVYAFPVDRLLQQLKYGGHLALADWAGGALARAVRAARRHVARPDHFAALPLSAARQRERGFNQAREIAARAGAVLGLAPASPLVRIGSGPPQAALSWSQRAGNIRGAFEVRADVRGASIALVDDVMTTGATLAEAARTLKRAGAARVECWVVARTLKTG